MELLQTRQIKTSHTTIGPFEIDGAAFGYGLEPFDRGLTSEMTPEQIAAIKVPKLTAIPAGRYRIEKYFSPKHNAFVLHVLDVPSFDMIEIHIGNYYTDTDGCLLVGYGKVTDMVTDSTDAINELYKQAFAALDNNEEVWITYQDAA